jgi:hypothetical protein
LPERSHVRLRRGGIDGHERLVEGGRRPGDEIKHVLLRLAEEELHLARFAHDQLAQPPV